MLAFQLRFSPSSPRVLATLVALLLALAVAAEPAHAARRRRAHEATGFQLFASPQSNPIALSEDGSRVYVANTTSNSVDVIDTASNTVIASVRVGIDPVGVAVGPGANEVWVSKQDTH